MSQAKASGKQFIETSSGKRRLELIVIAGSAAIGLGLYVFAAKPNMLVSNIDLGVYTPGQSFERVLPIANKGFRTLKISNIKTCCGVSLPLGYPRRIGPRTTAYIPVRVQTPVDYSELKRVVVVASENDKPYSEVYILGKPETSVIISPPAIDLGYIRPESHLNGVTKISCDEGIELQYATTSDAYLKAIQREYDNGKYIDLSISKDAPYGEFREYIYIKTNFIKKRNLIVPVRGFLERGLRVRPLQVFFNLIEKGEKSRREVDIEVIDSTWNDFEIGSLQHSGIKAHIESESEKRFRLCVDIDPLKTPLPVNSFITLKNSLGESIKVPLTATNKDIPKAWVE